jgi:hypothetical protein
MAAIRNLHRWRIGIAINRYNFDTVALQLYDDFLTQLAATQ